MNQSNKDSSAQNGIFRRHGVHVVVSVLLCFLFLLPFLSFRFTKDKEAKAADWYNYTWKYRKEITVDNSSNGDTLSNYQVLIDEGIRAYWDMDEPSGTLVSDSSGYDNNGGVSGTTIVSGNTGNGNARDFDGTDDYISAGNHYTTNLTDDITISAWIKPNGSDEDGYIFSRYAGGNYGYSLYWLGSQDKLRVTYGTGAASVNKDSSAVFVDNDTWVHVAVSIFSDGSATFYRNGSSAGTATGITPEYSTAITNYIGFRQGGSGVSDYFAGAIDELRVNNIAYSATEISYLYTNNISPRYSEIYANSQEDGADIRFTDSDGTTLIDYWIDGYTADGQNIKAWVEIPSIPANDTDTVYLYYGNDSASAVGSGNDTFLIFDDFNDNSIDLDKWSIEQVDSPNGITISEENQQLRMSGKVTKQYWKNNWLKSEDTLPTKYAVEAKQSAMIGSGTEFATYIWTGGKLIGQHGGSQVPSLVGVADYTLNTQYDNSLLGDPHLYNLTYNGTELAAYADGRLIVSETVSIVDTNLGLLSRLRAINDTINIYFDDVFARNFTNPEPTISTIAIEEQGDTTDPTNPTSLKAYDDNTKTTEYTSDDWANDETVYFEWSGATDAQSGVAGYYLYFGETIDADPATTSGLIPANDSGKYLATGTNYSLDMNLDSGTTYYFRLKTIDSSDNVSDTAIAFVYKLDSTPPSIPESINVSPQGCSTQSTFTFTWSASSDSESGLSSYEYKKGTGGTPIDIGDVLEVETTSYQDGDNVLFVRSVDNAGNQSSWQSGIYCSTAAAHIVEGPEVTAGPSSITVIWTSSKSTTGFVEVYDGNTYVSEQGKNEYSLSHSVQVVGLKSEKSYRYRLSWTDQNGNIGQGAWHDTTTATTPQVINLISEETGPTSVLVSWETNYSSNSIVEYGVGDYLLNTSSQGYSTSFSEQLTGLSSGSIYNLRVLATTDDGSEFSGGITFHTPPLPSISSLSFETVEDSATPSLKVSWKTNVDTTSSVFYKVEGGSFKEISSSEKTSDHTLTISNLEDSTTYQIYAYGIDQYGNIAKSDTNSFQTPLDTRPPTVSDITIETSNVGLGNQDEAQIVVSWKTDEPASSFVEYGEGISGSDYNFKTNTDPTLTTSHLVIISGLKENTPYHLRVASTDKGDNTTYSTDNTVIPGEVNKSTLTLILNALSNAFGWLSRWF